MKLLEDGFSLQEGIEGAHRGEGGAIQGSRAWQCPLWLLLGNKVLPEQTKTHS